MALRPAHTVSVFGGHDPDSWTYELTLAGPSATVTRTLPADRVLHLRYAINPSHPWRGISPIDAGRTTKALLANLESRLSQEAGGPVGSLIPVPSVQASGQLQTDLRRLTGEVTLVETTSTNWGAGATGAPHGDFLVRRVGADPPEILAKLRREVEQSVLASCGIPQSALIGGDGTGARESFRQFLHLTIAPVALEITGQIAARFETPVDFNFDRLMASDLSGRARAFQSMVGGGMDVGRAAALAGLMESQE